MAKDSFVNSDERATPSRTSTTFLACLQAGRKEAWSQLVAVYGPLVYGWRRRRGLQPADAEDVTQEVFQAVVADGLAGFRVEPGHKFRAWLRTITERKVVDHRRRNQHVGAGGTGWNPRWPEVIDRRGDIVAEEEEDSVSFLTSIRDLARQQFEERTWEAFRRVVIDGRRTADVAAELGMTTNAVHVARSKVLRRLRELRDELGGLRR